MSNLITLNDIKDPDELLSLLTDKNILVYEDVQGSKIYVNWTSREFLVKPKSLSNTHLNQVDLTIQKYYQLVFNHFNSLNDNIKELMHKNWWFCFEYFYDEQPGNIKYDRIPKNHLILTGIVNLETKTKKNWIVNINLLKEWSDLLKVEMLPIIHQGKFTEEQINNIKLFLTTSPNDLEFIFGENNFSKFFYDILDSNIKNSFLMKDDKFQDNLEKIIIVIQDDKNSKLNLQILNPLFQKFSENNSMEYVEIYSLILISFMQWIQLVDLDSILLTKSSTLDLYLELMCLLYNEYVYNTSEEIDNLITTVPTFFKKDKFKVNLENIENNETIQKIRENSKLEYVFKIIVSSFYKKKYKELGLFTEQLLNDFNVIVDKIQDRIESELNIIPNTILIKKDFLTFDEYEKMKKKEKELDLNDFISDMTNDKNADKGKSPKTSKVPAKHIFDDKK